MLPDNRAMRNAVLLALELFIVMLLAAPVCAAPYRSYTYDYWGETVPSPQAYLPERVLGGKDLGVGEFKGPQDLYVDRHGYVYLLDSGNNRVIQLDSGLQVVRVITELVRDDGTSDALRNPQGVFVTEDGLIYIADRDNGRVVALDETGRIVKEIGAPKTDVAGVLPEGFVYKPVKICVDRAQRTYVIAQDVYDGLLEFDSAGNFKGYVGATRVSPSLVDLFWSRLSTREQRERMALFLPTEYSNLDLDAKGFICATVASQGQAVRLLSPSGNDVLRKPPVGDIQTAASSSATIAGPSVFVDVASRQYGIYSVLDRRRSRVFTYDSMGRLLYVFGGPGDMDGTFKDPVAIDTIGYKILVLDRGTNRLTVMRPTGYAQLIHSAIALYNNGHYSESARLWENVVALNANYDLAYSGIGKALLRQGDYRQAMRYFRLGNDREGYSDAFAAFRRESVGKYFGPIATTLLVAILAAYFMVVLGITGRAAEWLRRRLSGLQSVRRLGRWVADSVYVAFHPFDGFYRLKQRHGADLPAAVAITLLLTATYLFVCQYTGFLLNTRDVTRLNILVQVASVVVPLLLWCVANWCLTTLMDGKGTLRDIFIVTAHALAPLVLVTIPLTVVSNLITLEEAGLYRLFLVAGIVWSAVLVFVGTMIVHEFDFAKTVGTSALTVVCMGTIIFIGMLFFSVIDLMVAFVSSIYTEIVLKG